MLRILLNSIAVYLIKTGTVYMKTAQRSFTVFQRLIDLHIERAFSLQTVKMNYKNKHPWMTTELRIQIKKKKYIIQYE